MNEEQPINKMRTSDTGLNTIEWRLANIEKHNQVRKISSEDGSTYFDTELGEITINDPSGLGVITIGHGKIVVNDGTNDRVIIGELS